jgi:hypothetical protein
MSIDMLLQNIASRTLMMFYGQYFVGNGEALFLSRHVSVCDFIVRPTQTQSPLRDMLDVCLVSLCLS